MTNVVKSRLTYIKRTRGGKHAKALYKCECGNEKEILEYPVKKGIVVSCGCYHKEIHFKHGLLEHPLYSIWSNMKHRCNCEDAENYEDYGGRGVRFCEEWNEFMNFYTWSLTNGWEKGLQLDKDIIPQKLGIEPLLYSPDYCCYVVSKENNSAKRNCRIIEFNGKKQTLTMWSEEYNLVLSTLARRLKGNNWVMKAEFLKPARFKSPNGSKKINNGK